MCSDVVAGRCAAASPSQTAEEAHLHWIGKKTYLPVTMLHDFKLPPVNVVGSRELVLRAIR
jgi:hypothetical protein